MQERLLGRQTFAILRELEESQWWSRERRDAFRLQRLQDVVQSAWDHSSFWQATMKKHGISPGGIQSLSDLQKFPLLEKRTVRIEKENIVWREEGPRLQIARTCGSTNEPLPFYTNSNREAHINAARMHGHQWVGMRRGEREMYFWGSPVELSKQDRVKRIRDWLINDALTDGFAVKPELVSQYFEYWKRWRPKCIFSYPCSLKLLVIMAKEAGIDLSILSDRGLKMIITTAEVVNDYDRQMISQAFGVPVYDSYGLREGGLIGHECDHFTMHCMEEQLILETIDPDTLQPTDGEGELVLTNIFSKVMPMIRYRTGDIVTMSHTECPCGRNLSSIRVSGGRITDFIITSNGTWVPGNPIAYVCRVIPGVIKFQIYQDRIGQIRILMVTDKSFPAEGPEQVRATVLKRLKSNDEILVELVDEIPPAPSGKQRLVIGSLAERMRGENRLSVNTGNI